MPKKEETQSKIEKTQYEKRTIGWGLNFYSVNGAN